MGINLHVVPHPKGWAVRRTGGRRAIRVCRTRHMAIFYASVLQESMEVPIYIHNTDGSVNCKLGVEE